MKTAPLHTPSRGRIVQPLLIAASLLSSLPAEGAAYTWNGSAGDGSFANSLNWDSGDPLPTIANDWTFTGSLSPSITLDAKSGSSSWRAGRIVFDNAASSFNLGGYPSGTVGPVGGNRFQLEAASEIVQNSSAAQRISSHLYLASGITTVTGTGAGELFLDAIRFHAGNGGAFHFNRSATIGAITSAAMGAGVTEFSVKSPAALTFADSSTGSLGRLSFTSGNDTGNAISATHSAGLTVNAHLETDRNLSFTGSREIRVNQGFTLLGNQGKTLTFAGSGGTRFTQGQLQLGAVNGTASRDVAFQVDAGAVAVETVITGSASSGATGVSKTGAGTLILNAANTFNGGLLLSEGVLLAENSTGSATGSGAVSVTGGLLGGHGRIAPNGETITIGSASVAVGTVGESIGSGIVSLTLGAAEITGSTLSLAASSSLHLDIWSADDYERMVFQLDSLDLGGASLHLDTAYSGFTSGQEFQLFDWSATTVLNTFDQLYLPTLDAALRWDTSALYTEGRLSVAAIPEPGSILLALLSACGIFVWRSRRSAAYAVAGAALMTAPCVVAQEAILDAGEELEIEARSNHTFPFEVGSVPADQELILEFTAWYQGKTAQGFAAAMRVLVDGEDLLDVLDRPAAFTAKDGNLREVRGPRGWRVAILGNPTDAANPNQRYFVSPEEIADVTRFRFRLPPLAAGTYQLSINNDFRVSPEAEGDVASSLKIQDVKITLSPKGGSH